MTEYNDDDFKFRNHFVPQCYLRNFSGGLHGNDLYVFDSYGHGKPIRKSPKSLGKQDRLYWTYVDGEDQDFFENEFGKLEKSWGRTFENIRNKQNLNAITNLDLYNLGTFIAFQMMRVPPLVEKFTEFGEFMFYKTMIELKNFPDSDLQREIFFKTNSPKKFALEAIFKRAKEIVKSLNNCMFFFHISDGPLITSDQPVIQLEGNKLLSSSEFYPLFTNLIIPVSRESSIQFVRKSPSMRLNFIPYEQLNEFIIRSSNSNIFLNPNDQTYAISKVSTIRNIYNQHNSVSAPTHHIFPIFDFRITDPKTGVRLIDESMVRTSDLI